MFAGIVGGGGRSKVGNLLSRPALALTKMLHNQIDKLLLMITNSMCTTPKHGADDHVSTGARTQSALL